MAYGWKREAATRQPIAAIMAMIRADIAQAQSDKGIPWMPSTETLGAYRSQTQDQWKKVGETLHLPKGTYSVRKEARTFHITVTAAPEGKVYSDVGMWWHYASSYGAEAGEIDAAARKRNGGGMSFRSPLLQSVAGREVLETIQKIIGAYNYNNSDSMTDYTDVGFFSSVRFADGLESKAEQRAKLDVQLLRAAHPPERVIDLLVEAAYEQSWHDHQEKKPLPTPYGDRLRAEVERVRHERREGVLRIPFAMRDREGWMEYSRAWIRSFKIKGKGGGEIAAHVAHQPQQALVEGATGEPGEFNWVVAKNYGFARGRYQNQDLIATGWSPSQEDAVYAAEEALGLDPFAEVSEEALAGAAGVSSGSLLLAGAAGVLALALAAKSKRSRASST